MLSLPIIISGIFYVLLVWSQFTTAFKNNVNVVLEPDSIEMVNNISNCIPELRYDALKTPTQDVQMMGHNEGNNKMQSVDFDYNKILMESGMPFDTTVRNVECAGENKDKSRNVFLVKDNSKKATKSGLFYVLTQCQNSVENHSTKQSNVDNAPIENATDRNKIQTKGNMNSSILSLSVKNENEEDLITNLENQTINGDFQNDELATNEDLINEKQHLAEKTAAIKSLETNLILILIFCLSNLFFLIPSKILQTYFCIVSSSAQRALLPIVTTMTNFGTIRSVAFQFWNVFFKK